MAEADSTRPRIRTDRQRASALADWQAAARSSRRTEMWPLRHRTRRHGSAAARTMDTARTGRDRRA